MINRANIHAQVDAVEGFLTFIDVRDVVVVALWSVKTVIVV